MRSLLPILAIFFALFWVKPAFAVTITTSNVPPTITGESFSFNVSVTGASAGTNYLRVDLYKDGTTNYFGETYNGTSWYSGSDGKQYLPITIVSGQTWNGSIQGRVGSPTYTEFPGSGSYKVRVRRYTSSGNPSSSDQQTPQDVTIAIDTVASSPSPSPSTSQSPSASSASSSSSSFTISNVPSQIDSTETFNVSVNLSIPNSPSTNFYLKGAFKKPDSSNYFGLTKVSGSWIKNNKTYSDQYKITTDSSGGWSGNLEIQPDILDSGYEGSGDYVFKVGRYTEGGSLKWSNEISIKINAQEVVLEEAKDTDILGTKSDTGKKSKISTSKAEELSLERYIKVATPSSKPPSATPSAEVKGERRINFLSILGTIIVIIGAIPIVYAIYNKFRTRNKEIS